MIRLLHLFFMFFMIIMNFIRNVLDQIFPLFTFMLKTRSSQWPSSSIIYGLIVNPLHLMNHQFFNFKASWTIHLLPVLLILISIINEATIFRDIYAFLYVNWAFHYLMLLLSIVLLICDLKWAFSLTPTFVTIIRWIIGLWGTRCINLNKLIVINLNLVEVTFASNLLIRSF